MKLNIKSSYYVMSYTNVVIIIVIVKLNCIISAALYNNNYNTKKMQAYVLSRVPQFTS